MKRASRPTASGWTRRQQRCLHEDVVATSKTRGICEFCSGVVRVRHGGYVLENRPAKTPRPIYLKGCGPDCPCQHPAFDVATSRRIVFSTGARYTLDEIEPGVFVYAYVAAEVRA